MFVTLHVQVFAQIYNFFVGTDIDKLSVNKLSVANTVKTIAESYFRSNWSCAEEALFSVGHVVDAVLDGLTVELTGGRQIIPYAGASFYNESSCCFKKMKAAFPSDCMVEIERAVEEAYEQYAAVVRSPIDTLERGPIRLYFVSAGRMPPAKITQELLDMCARDSIQQRGTTHIVLVVRTVADLMKPRALWHEDDRTSSVLTTLTRPDKSESEVKLRGKHELLYGAYTKDTKPPLQPVAWSPFETEDEIREHGDKIFRALIRCLHKWLTLSSPGDRRVTIVSTNWSGGVDFSLTLDGNVDYFVNHICLEVCAKSNDAMSEDVAMVVNRMRHSFNDRVAVELGTFHQNVRAIGLEINSNSQSAMSCNEEFVVTSTTDMRQKVSPTPLLLQGVRLNPHPRISDISHDMVSVEIQGSGFGYVVASIYEVPYMTTHSDASRLLATELSSMKPTTIKFKRCIGSMTEDFIFEKLTAFCAYCVIISDELHPPEKNWRPQVPQDQSSTPLIFLHFRTMEKKDGVVNTCLLAGISEEDCAYPSDVISNMADQLDGARRPLAAPVVLIESDCYRRNPHSKESTVRSYSSELHKLCGMTHVVHCGIDDYNFSLQNYDYDGIIQYDKTVGGINFTINGRFCRLSLMSNTEKALRKLHEAVCTIDDLEYIENIQVFAPRPLVPHMENTEATLWKQSRHFTSVLYYQAVSKVMARIIEWKEAKPGRDCQIYSTSHIIEPVVCYIHRAKQHIFGGIRQFILPIRTGTKSSDERIVIPFGINKLSDQLHSANFLCTNNDMKGELPPGNPCQIVPPLFHLQGLKETDFSNVSKKIVYKIVSLVGAQEDDEEDALAAQALYGYHHHVIIKMVTHDIDNVELVLGPVVGSVSYSSCIILFEVNREVCKLKCVIRAVENPDVEIDVVQRCDPYSPVKYEFNNLESGSVYEIFIPEIYGTKALGKFRTLSTKSLYSEMIFLGDEHLEHFPVAGILCQELAHQQVINFSHLQCESMVKKYVSDMKVLRNPLANNTDSAPTYRRPWNALGERMKSLACTTSAVFHIGSHALLSRLVRELAIPFVEIVKKYNLDDENAVMESALTKLYYMQLVQVLEDSLRLVWVIEPSIKDVFQSASNIPLYNAEYWLSETDIWGPGSSGESERDLKALEIVRQLYQKSLISYIYALRNWNKRSYSHFFRWNEGTVAVAALDQTSEQLEALNKSKASLKAEGGVDEAVAEESQTLEGDIEEEDEEGESKGTGAKKSTFSSAFMTENQWKQIRQILVDKSVNQLVLCSQYPLIPLRQVDEEYSKSMLWNPPEDDVKKFFDQLIKWLSPKKTSVSGKTVTLVTMSDVSYVTNIRHMMSGMNIQQICLGKFSCVNKAFKGSRKVTASNIIQSGRLGGLKYIHRVHGLDMVCLDSSRLGGGGRYTGDSSPWHKDDHGVYAVLRFWFDSWMATGSVSFNPVCPIGPPDEKTTKQAVVVVGPIVGAPYITLTKDGNRMMVPVLLEVDRDIDISMIATDLFSGKQLTRSMHLQKLIPTVIRVGPLRLDSRYTLDFNEGVQNAHASRFILQTSVNWSETNIIILNAEANGAEDPAKNSSDYIHDIANRFSVPFHGLSAALHTNVHVDVSAILDEVKAMPGLNRIMERAKIASSDGVSSMLLKFVRNVMERVRIEYRLFFSKPSYREILVKGFNIFMAKDDSKTQHEDGEDSLMSLLNLIVSRVRQEYFDQFICLDDRVYSAWPRVKASKEQAAFIKREYEKEQFIGDMMVLTGDNIADDHILKIPKVRKPDRIYFDPKEDVATCILHQWTKNLVPPPPLWTTWVSPNGRVRIERCCSTEDENIREVHDIIMKSNVPTGARIIVLPSIGNLLNSQCRVGYKMQEWIQRWVGKDSGRSISLICPSFNGEGTYLCSVDYFDGYAQLIVQMLNSVFCSNEKIVAKAKRDKLAVIKKKTAKTSSSRKAIAKRLELEKELKAQMQVELDTLFNELTTDGYVIYESKCISAELEGTSETVTVITAEMKCISSKTDTTTDEFGNLLYPKPTIYDHMNLPQWFTKFCPGTPGVFVQDEVNIILRHDPNYRSALKIIELDDKLFTDMQRVFEASPLSEMSRPVDLREVDVDIPGILEMSLENTIEKIWLEVLPMELKGRMLTLTDDFIRQYCCARAFADLQIALSSSVNFASAMKVLILGAIQLFLACKMATGPESDRWKYLLETPEFPEDFDIPYKSDNSSDEDIEEEEEKGEVEEAEAQVDEANVENAKHQDTSELAEGEDNAVAAEQSLETGVGERDDFDSRVAEPGAGYTTETQPTGETELTEKDKLTEALYGDIYQLSYRRVQKRQSYGEKIMFMSTKLHM